MNAPSIGKPGLTEFQRQRTLKLSDRSIDHYHVGQLSVTDESMNAPSNGKPGLSQCPLKLSDRLIDHYHVGQLSVSDESMNAPSNDKLASLNVH